MAHQGVVWAIEEISFDIVEGMTDHPVVCLPIATPIGDLAFVAEPVAEENGRILRLRGTHVQGAHRGAVGVSKLRLIAEAVMRGVGVDGLVVEGAVRTSGARPGRRPRDVRFSRRLPAPGTSGPVRRQDC